MHAKYRYFSVYRSTYGLQALFLVVCLGTTPDTFYLCSLADEQMLAAESIAYFSRATTTGDVL